MAKITYELGDIFYSPAEYVVIPVNCFGVAGIGLAAACKRRYPQWFQEYQAACQAGKVQIGFPTFHHCYPKRYFISFPTKYHWSDPSRLFSIEAGLQTLLNLEESMEISSIAFPKLGCGAGGLSWSVVRPVMELYLSQLECEVTIHELRS